MAEPSRFKPSVQAYSTLPMAGPTYQVSPRWFLVYAAHESYSDRPYSDLGRWERSGEFPGFIWSHQKTNYIRPFVQGLRIGIKGYFCGDHLVIILRLLAQRTGVAEDLVTGRPIDQNGNIPKKAPGWRNLPDQWVLCVQPWLVAPQPSPQRASPQNWLLEVQPLAPSRGSRTRTLLKGKVFASLARR